MAETPKPVTPERCRVLNSHGRRCRRVAVAEVNYHGDNELYSSFSDDHMPGWVRVPMCERHRKAVER